MSYASKVTLKVSFVGMLQSGVQQNLLTTVFLPAFIAGVILAFEYVKPLIPVIISEYAWSVIIWFESFISLAIIS